MSVPATVLFLGWNRELARQAIAIRSGFDYEGVARSSLAARSLISSHSLTCLRTIVVCLRAAQQS